MSGARTATRIPAYSSAANRPRTTSSPISPSSSPRIEKMKSVWAFGTYIHFCRLIPSPTPNHPPEPSAISDWINW